MRRQPRDEPLVVRDEDDRSWVLLERPLERLATATVPRAPRQLTSGAGGATA
jgi:hypothetical protein